MLNEGVSKVVLSIIVPVYNVEKYLDRCITSLLNQDINQYEIILIDDGSTDSSGKICDKWAKFNSFIRVIHTKNTGVANARNIGIEASQGEYLAYVDSDDYVKDGAFKKILTVLDETNADVCYFGYSDVFYDKKEVQLTPIPQKLEYSGKSTYDFAKDIIGNKPESTSFMFSGVSSWSGVTKKELIDKYKISFPSNMKAMNEDMFYNLSVSLHSEKIVIIPERLYYYCHNDNDSLTLSYREDRFETTKNTYNILLEQFSDYIKIDEDIYLRIKRLFMTNVVACLKQEYIYKKANNIKEICNDSTVISVVNSYPIDKMSIKQKLLFTAVKHRSYLGIVFLFSLKKLGKYIRN